MQSLSGDRAGASVIGAVLLIAVVVVVAGREEVKNAFAPSSPPSYFLNVSIFENMEGRIK